MRKRRIWDPDLRGADYVPYETVHRVPSRGLSSRVPGYKAGRLHHLLSRLETNYCYLQEFQPSVIDIREQYALPLEDTQRIAEAMGVAHPRENGRGALKRMTTDFVLTIRVGHGLVDVARACKYESELQQRRPLEKLAIEQRWWESRGFDWKIVTEEHLPAAFVANARLLHPFLDEAGLRVRRDMVLPLTSRLREVVERRSGPLALLCLAEDDKHGLPHGAHLSLAFHAIGRRRWQVDLAARIDSLRPLHLLT